MPAPKAKKNSLIDHLNAQAPAKPVNELLGIQKYYASADLLLRQAGFCCYPTICRSISATFKAPYPVKQASSYRLSKNEEQLYVMLMRFAR
jgi:hypothetical protein